MTLDVDDGVLESGSNPLPQLHVRCAPCSYTAPTTWSRYSSFTSPQRHCALKGYRQSRFPNPLSPLLLPLRLARLDLFQFLPNEQQHPERQPPHLLDHLRLSHNPITHLSILAKSSLVSSSSQLSSHRCALASPPGISVSSSPQSVYQSQIISRVSLSSGFPVWAYVRLRAGQGGID